MYLNTNTDTYIDIYMHVYIYMYTYIYVFIYTSSCLIIRFSARPLILYGLQTLSRPTYLIP